MKQTLIQKEIKWLFGEKRAQILSSSFANAPVPLEPKRMSTGSL